MPYFACDECNVSSLVEEVIEQVATPKKRVNWLALLDTAFDVEGTPLRSIAPSVRLYKQGKLEALRGVSPALYQLPLDDDAFLKKALTALLRHASGRPMLSFISSRLNAEQLARQFQDVLEVRTSDQQAFVLRLADTRALPAIGLAFDAQHWARITRHIECWMIVSRRAMLEPLRLADRVASDEPDGEPIVLSDVELDRLLALGQPDALVQSLYENFPDLLPGKHRADFHQLMADVCQFGLRHRISAFPELMALAVAVAATSSQLLHHPGLCHWLDARAWSEGQFEDGLAQFMEITG